MEKIKKLIAENKKLSLIILGVVVAAVVGVIVISGLTGDDSKKENQGNTNKVTTNESQSNGTSTNPGTEENDTEQPTTENVAIDKPYINPLTGEATAEDCSNKRPVAVMLNTIRQALPQSGNSKADILIEMAEEGGITRVMGLYQNLSGVGKIGTVRSTREFYYSWAQGFDAILVHVGGDSWVLNQIAADGNLTIDSISRDKGAFWRDEERLNTHSLEHTLYTSSDNLTKWLENSNVPTTHTKDNYTKFNFVDKLKDGYMDDKASSVKVKFSGYKTTSFKYNEATGKYEVFFWDNESYVDEVTSTQVEVTNVIVLPVTNWTKNDDWGVERQKYDMTGGEGYYICNGQYKKIKWTKGDYNKVAEYGNPFSITTLDGEELEMAVGKTYICVLSKNMEVSFSGE